MNKFIEISPKFLAAMAADGDGIPRLYFAGNWMLRRMFWQRLYVLNQLIRRRLQHCEHGLDFGGGSGVMLPNLAAQFRRVTLVDLQTRQARLVKAHYRLANVDIVEGDATRLDLSHSQFDAAIAADVLEHFPDLRMPVRALRRCLTPGGQLFTSVPTENWVYRLLRKLFGIEKPSDHYHTGYEVEAFLAANGFQRTHTVFVPAYMPMMPLFLISVWRVAGLEGSEPTPVPKE